MTGQCELEYPRKEKHAEESDESCVESSHEGTELIEWMVGSFMRIWCEEVMLFQ
jgi:hypothetical protein